MFVVLSLEFGLVFREKSMRHASRYIGAPLSAVPTPALVLHMPSLEKNDLALRSLLAASHNKPRLRPHAKALKSAAFANWLLTRAAMDGMQLAC